MSADMEVMTLDLLHDRCKSASVKYLRGEASDQSYCLEIFLRALSRAVSAGGTPPVYPDEEARAVLVSIYTQVIRATINRHALYSSSVDELIQGTWLRFWQWVNTKAEG